MVYHIDVGPLADFQSASVAQAEQLGRVVGLLAHHPFQRKLFATGAVSRPVGDHVGGDGGIADHPAVRSAVAQPRHRLRMRELLADHIVIAVEVVEERQQQQGVPVLFAEQVVCHFH